MLQCLQFCDYEVWQLNPGCGGCGRNNLPHCGAEPGVGAVELPAAGDPVLPEFPATVALATAHERTNRQCGRLAADRVGPGGPAAGGLWVVELLCR